MNDGAGGLRHRRAGCLARHVAGVLTRVLGLPKFIFPFKAGFSSLSSLLTLRMEFGDSERSSGENFEWMLCSSPLPSRSCPTPQ